MKGNVSVLDNLILRAKGSNKTIVLPEGEEKRVIDAAILAAESDVCKVVLIGRERVIKKQIPEKIKNKIEVVEIEKSKEKLVRYASRLYELRKHKGLTRQQAEEQVKLPIVFGTVMVELGEADGLVAGIVTHTADVIKPAFQIIKSKNQNSKVSSIMIMQMPKGSPYGENGVLVFADCGIIPYPDSADLASIAIDSARSAKLFCGIDPKVALLSYSTKSPQDQKDENIIKIKQAVSLAKKLEPNLVIDGEVQADAAIVPEVSELKCKDSVLKGRANVLVFPDLASSNIAYKLVQRIANVEAVGPILQGLNKPVNDVSRGATSQEMFRVIAITVLQSQN